MIIDAHNHPDWYYKDMDATIAEMDSWGIDQTIMLSWECPEDEFEPDQRNVLSPGLREGDPVPYEKCLAYQKARPDRFILGFAPDHRKPEAMDRLEAAFFMHHVRVCGEVKLRTLYDNPDAVRMFRFCGEHGLPVVLHMEYPIPLNQKYPRPNWWYGGGMGMLERLLNACPKTNFLGHAMGFWSNIADDGQQKTAFYPKGKVTKEGKLLTLLRKYPNLYCDISANSGRNALARDPEFAKGFLTEFEDRVVFARDSFGNAHRELLESLGLPDGSMRKIYSENILRLLGG